MLKNTKSPLKTNEFYDINKLSSQPGITVLGISMPLINNRQSATKCFDATKLLISKIKKSNVGAVIAYSDGLYMNSDESAFELKKKFQLLMEEHKQKYLDLINKDINVISKAFSFVTWSQLILSCPNFNKYLKQFQKIYKENKELQKYVNLDITSNDKKICNESIAYILEETLLDHLVAMGKVRLQNDFVDDHEKWILNCYHGKPHRTHVFIYQQNFFKLNSTNIYAGNWYDITNKKLYDFDRLDIETFNFKKA